MLGVFKDDKDLLKFEGQIKQRVEAYKNWKDNLEKNEGGLLKFAEGYKIFGFQRNEAEKKYTFTEWLPKAKNTWLVGEFNGWQQTHQMRDAGYGRWSIDFPDNADGTPSIKHRTQYRIKIETQDGQWIDRVSAWAPLAWQDKSTNMFNGVFWEPPPSERYTLKHPRPPRPPNLKVYEAHVGIAGFEPRVHTYTEFKDHVLPVIKRLGYNAVQLMAIAEHAHYGSFGYHVTSFFAPASRSGTPDELKDLIDTAHALGITVLMDLVHAHCSSNCIDGIAQMDGSDHCYTHGGAKGKQEQWDSSLFDFNKWEVLRFLLSNIKWWLQEYGFDGFRFDGVTSMLYHSHGINKAYSGGYHEYFGPDSDIESHTYLMLANDLIRQLLPKTSVSIAEDVSGMPTLCRPVEEGGFGFDYRLSMAVPDMWIKLLKETPDEGWTMGHIAHTLQNRRWKEPCIAYAESHDQAIVGDKTIAFWLMDKEMYTHMSCLSPENAVVDRGLALHKMIRLVTLGLGGEGYLNFIGNEFGHPEWLDFPTPLNGWTYNYAIRRMDLPKDNLLKYKFFEAFDESMQALDNRFQFVCSPHQFCSRKDEGDKVLVFERGDCLFIFNFHSTKSFTDYAIGHKWNEGMRIVLDSDESRFGGQHRLDWGHWNSFPPLPGHDNREFSIKCYLPSRTCQVLVRESLLKSNVTIRLLSGEGRAQWPFPLEDLQLVPLDQKGEEQAPKAFTADEDGKLIVKLDGGAQFKIKTAKGETLPYAPEVYKAPFNGTYVLDALGNLTCVGGEGAADPLMGDPTPLGCTIPAK